MPRGFRIVDANGIVHDIANFVTAVSGEAKVIGAGWIADQGVVRQFWPPTTVLGDPLVMTTDTELSYDSALLGQTPPKAICSFNAQNGLITLSTEDGTRFVQVIGPAPRETGKFLWKFDVVSGNVVADDGDPIGSWVDMLSETTIGTKDYSLTNAQGAISVEAGEATVTVAEDDGAGAPAAGTEIAKTINFQAEITGPNLLWTTVPWNLSDVQVLTSATCAISVLPTGDVVGFEHAVEAERETYAENVTPDFTVQVDVISGTVSGEQTGVALTTDEIRTWSLAALNLGDTFNNELDVIISDGVSSVTKRVNMNVQKVDESSSTEISDDWTQFDRIDDFYDEFEGTGAPVPDISVDIVFYPDGTVNALRSGNSNPPRPPQVENFPQDWNTSAPGVTDPENYEIRLVVDSGPTPNGPTAGIWWNLSSNQNWGFVWTEDVLPPGPSPQLFLNSYCTISIREVGRPDTEKQKSVQFHLNYQVQDYVPPGQQPP